MNLLAFDTSTETMSIAVQRSGQTQAWVHLGPGGPQASTQLIPQIEALMDQAGLRYAQLDAIAFGAGPGSFTGLRTACAVAQGLGFAAGVPLLPVDTLLALASQARMQVDVGQNFDVTALLDARMGEIYCAGYRYADGRWTQRAPVRLIRPEQFDLAEAGDWLAGNVFETYGARLPQAGLPCITALPSAAAMLRLAPMLLAARQGVPAAQALPTYVRDKVAQTTEERAALKAAGGAG